MGPYRRLQGALVFQDLTYLGAASVGIRGNSTVSFTGNSELVLDKTFTGSGNLILNNAGRTTLTNTGYGSSAFLGDIDIQSGLVRLGNSFVFGTTSGSTYVRDGATLDLAGQGSNAMTTTATSERLVLAGAGVGGQGALVNSYVNNTNPAYFLRNVVLAGNTTIAAEGRLDIRDNTTSALLDMGGFDLTKTGAGVLELGLTNPVSNPGNLNVTAGTLLLEFGTDLGAPTGKSINLAAGTNLNFYGLTARQRWTINAADNTTLALTQDSVTQRVDGQLNLAGTTTIGGNAGTSRGYQFWQPITGPGNLSLNASGSTFLLANNTYAGTTRVANNNVYVGRNFVDGSVDGLAVSTTGSLGAGAVTIAGALLDFTRTDDIIVPNAITASGGGLIGGATSWPVATRGGKITFTGPVSLSGTGYARTSNGIFEFRGRSPRPCRRPTASSSAPRVP